MSSININGIKKEEVLCASKYTDAFSTRDSDFPFIIYLYLGTRLKRQKAQLFAIAGLRGKGEQHYRAFLKVAAPIDITVGLPRKKLYKSQVKLKSSQVLILSTKIQNSPHTVHPT